MKPERILAGSVIAVLALLGLAVRPEAVPARAAGPETASGQRPGGSAPPAPPLSVKPEDAFRLDCRARGVTDPAATRCGIPEIMIATVPDPKRSGIPALFDSAIESIQRAAAESDFGLVHARVDTVGDGQTGLLTFRAGERVLIVLLVGETPMAGVDLTSFELALSIQAEVNPACMARVLGPTFSGSVTSLAQVVERNPGREIRFVSGTATRAANRDDLAAAGGGRVEYYSLAENDDLTREAFLEFLRARGISPSRVAILAEAGTAFGRALVDSNSGLRPGLTAEFPMQISRLRAAYQTNPSLRTLWRRNSESGPNAQLNAGFEVAASERPAAAAKDQTAMELELGVAELASAVNRERIQVAIVTASDEADTLFLAKILQRLSPNVRLATLDADLIYLHTTPDLSYGGMMMVTPYPLWLPNQVAGEGSRRLQPFTSRASQGVFNAARVLLGDRGPGLVEFRHPLRELRYPPIWVTIVGGGDVWPMAILDQPAGKKSTLEEASRLLPEAGSASLPKPPWSGWFFFLFVCNAVMAGWTMWNYYRFTRGEADVLMPFELPEDDTRTRAVLYAILIGSGFVLFAQYMVVLLSPRVGECGVAWSAARVLALAVPAACIPLGMAGKSNRLRRLTFGLSAVAWGFFAWYYWVIASDDAVALPFAARALNPFSGVDPVSPQVLVWFGVLWWAALTLHRLRMAELRDPGNPFGQKSPHGLGEAFEGLRSWLNGPKWSKQALPVAISATCLLGTLGSRLNLGLEPLTWQITYLAGFLLLWILCTGAAVRIVQIACDVTAALRPLPWLSLGDAFGRLDKDIAVSDMWARGNRRFPFEGVNYCIDLLKKLASTLRDRQFDAQFDQARQALERCRLAGREGRPLPTAQAQLVNSTLTGIGGGFARDLGLVAGEREKFPHKELTAQKEEYVALRIVMLVWYAILHVRLLLEFLTIAIVCMFLSILSYPFQPNTALVNAVTLLALGCGAATLFVLQQLDSNEILRKLRADSKTTWTESFYARAIAYAVLPVLAALANRFPGTLRKLGDLIEPLTKLASG